MVTILALALLGCGTSSVPEPPLDRPVVPEVWVPRAAVPVGETLTEHHLEQRPVAWLHPDLRPPALEALVGTTPREPLDAGVPVRMEHLASRGNAVGLSAIVPKGLRALTIPVTTVAGLRPGTYADVYVGHERQGPVLRAVTLLGVHEGGPEHEPALTLAVTPQMVPHLLTSAPTSVSINHPVAVTHIDEHGAIALSGDSEAGAGVAVARRDLYQGVPITEEDLIALPAPGWPDTLSVEAVVGRMPMERILAGEAVQSDDLAALGEGRGLESAIPKEMRLIFVPMSGTRYHGMAPGSYVDVVAWHPDGGSEVVAQGLFVAAFLPGADGAPPHLGLVADYGTSHRVMAAMNRPGLELTPVLRGAGDEVEADYGLEARD